MMSNSRRMIKRSRLHNTYLRHRLYEDHDVIDRSLDRVSIDNDLIVYTPISAIKECVKSWFEVDNDMINSIKSILPCKVKYEVKGEGDYFKVFLGISCGYDVDDEIDYSVNEDDTDVNIDLVYEVVRKLSKRLARYLYFIFKDVRVYERFKITKGNYGYYAQVADIKKSKDVGI